MTIEEQLESEFILRGYQWKVDGELVTPSAEDIRKVIDRCKELLGDGGQIEVARLIVRREDPNDPFDIYLHYGEEE